MVKPSTTTHEHPSPGDVFEDEVGPVRVMTITEGWIVVRRKGAMPFLCHSTEFMQKFRTKCSICNPED